MSDARLAAAMGRVVFGLLVCTATQAGAQCLLQYTAEVSPPIGYGGGTSDVSAKGTFDCGIVRGTTCALGTVTGDCTSNTNQAYTVSCVGTCGFDRGTITCDGTVEWSGNVSGQCLGSVCSISGDRDDGSSSIRSVSVADPTALRSNLSDCFPNGNGVSSVSYKGVAVLILKP